MHTPPNAARRPVRSGGTHLYLVTEQDGPDAPAVDDSERQQGKHAAPKLPLAGSATVRALLALGALLSAIGLSIGRADAVRSHHASEEQATDPETPPVVDGPAVVPQPPREATAAQATAAGYWAPTRAPVKAVTYKLPASAAGSGRHRAPRAGRVESTGPITPAGKHRRTVAAVQGKGHAGARRGTGVRAA